MKTNVQLPAREESYRNPNASSLQMLYNKEGIDFEKHFKVHALLRSTKLNRWYTSVTIGNICIRIQYTVHVCMLSFI